jgi:hypothetical protein
MNARAYFSLMDAIAAARTPDEIESVHARVASTDMHPFERRALERQVQGRALAMQLELERDGGVSPRPTDQSPRP